MPTATPTPQPPEPARPISETLQRLGGSPCPFSEFTCISLRVPLDHFAGGASGQTLDAAFAALPASGERTGMLVIAVGGPGSAGIALADAYVAAYDPRLREHFDIVFFDQRGIGSSGSLQCPEAAASYYRTDGRADTPKREAAVVEAARTFATDCLEQLSQPALLPYLGTRQAVEDLEAFRKAIGVDKLWLYGESYGTQYAQTYAAAHGDRVAGLILDGTVDLTRSGVDYATESTLAFEEVLSQTLSACAPDTACAADAGGGGDAFKAYNTLLARLSRGPVRFSFPLASGKPASRAFTRGDLDVAVAGYLGAPDARMMLLRALAASARGDLAPMARLLYSSLGVDPQTLQAEADPSYSDAAYYAVTCNDYAHFSGTADERAQAYLRAGDAVDAAAPRLGSLFYGDLPCAFWPSIPDSESRPEPLKAEGIPTLVLGATADPLTPIANGRRVYERLADGYLITTQGGAHVMFGRGQSCPDDLVVAFLADGAPPAERETACEGAVADEYVANAPRDARAFATPLEAMLSFNDQLRYLPEFYYWDGITPVAVGCPRGGSLTFEPRGAKAAFTLQNCAFSAGFALNGTGEYDSESGRYAFEVVVGGRARGQLSYAQEADGSARVTGTYGGKVVDLANEKE